MEVIKRELRHYLTPNGKNLFKEWLSSLKSIADQAAILNRLDRVEDGNLGDHRYVGQGVWELRVHISSGYRVYYAEHGKVVILLICGGNKHSQKKDIRFAQKLWRESQEE